jgi:hypothetical protein
MATLCITVEFSHWLHVNYLKQIRTLPQSQTYCRVEKDLRGRILVVQALMAISASCKTIAIVTVAALIIQVMNGIVI